MPVLMWSVFIVFGSRHRGFDFLSGAASDLGGVGAPDAALFNVLFFWAGGALTLLVAAAVLRSGLSGWPVPVAAVLIALGGASLILEGVVSTDAASADATQLHRELGLPLVLALAPAPVVLALAVFRHPDLRVYAVVSVILGAALMVVALLSRIAPLPAGAIQRSQAVLETIWFFATGSLLLRLRRHER